MHDAAHGHAAHGRAVVAFALGAAVLFGITSPAAKVLLADAAPLVLAGLLYLGAGAGLSAWWILRRVLHGPGAPAAALRARDLPALAGAVLFGGVLGPALQMAGLRVTPASTASLLLNLETVWTSLIAWIVVREHVDRRLAGGLALVVAGGVVLCAPGAAPGAPPWGALAIAGACLAWGVDNNVTRGLAERDPVQVAAIKGLAAGAFTLVAGLATGGAWPAGRIVLGAAALGVTGYGASLVLFVLALRHLGTGRTAAWFALGPFLGAAVAVLVLGEPPTAGMLGAGALMAAGAALLLGERHEHAHRHGDLVHSHPHYPDAEHRHDH